MGVQRHAPSALPPGKKPGTHCTEGWVGLRADVDWCGKTSPTLRFDPRTVQPVASRYTDRAIAAHEKVCQFSLFQKHQLSLGGVSKQKTEIPSTLQANRAIPCRLHVSNSPSAFNNYTSRREKCFLHRYVTVQLMMRFDTLQCAAMDGD